MSDEYKAKLRAFMAEKGRAVQFEEPRYSWQTGKEVSSYGWINMGAEDHVRPVGGGEGCRWIVEQGVELTEETYSMFTDTDADNAREVGINVSPVHCACGKYRDVTLRYVGSLTDVLHTLLELPTRPTLTL